MNRRLTQQEMDSALHRYPPIMTLTEVSELLQLKISTLYRHISEGKYNKAVKRGKPVRFWRDRLIQEFMLG